MRAGAFRVGNLARYRAVARLLRRYAAGGGGDDGFWPQADGAGPPEQLAADLEALGPTFVKLGQLLSTRPDLVPEPYMDALSRLQDRVEPFPFERAREIVEADLGAPLHDLFRSFSREPAASASLSQLHRAVLPDGRVVAVKVQRPGLRETIAADMAALAEAARFLDRHTSAGRRWEFSRLADDFRRSLRRELDFEEEAASLVRLGDAVSEFRRLVVPVPHERWCSSRVLTMDWIPGRKVTALSARAAAHAGGPELASQLFRAYLRQICVDGFFHADPHPGNVLLTADRRLVILDLGMTARIGPNLQQDLLELILAISESRSEDAADAAIELGSRREGFDEREFRRRVGPLVLDNADASMSRLNLGRVVVEIARVSGACGLRLPSELAIIGKALLNLDQVVAALHPEFEPFEAVRDESLRLMQEKLARRYSRANLTAGFLELQEFAERLPRRLGRVMDVLGRNELRLKIDALDENLILQGMQKIANRISLGVVLASLIIGAALMMQVETRFRIFEYPGLAILLFGAAAVASVLLAVDILYYDDKRKARLREMPGDPPA